MSTSLRLARLAVPLGGVALASLCGVLATGCTSKSSSSSGTPGIVGVAGPSGPQGPTGSQGGTGAANNTTGPTGPTGSQGSQGSTGSTGLPGPLGTPSAPMATALPVGADAVGCIVSILGVSGGTGPNGNPQPGDYVTVHYSVKTSAGLPIPLKELDYGEVILSGPAEEDIKYQSVIPVRTDLLALSTDSNGTYYYKYPVPIPQVYATPPNYNVSFGLQAGSLAGTQLLAGTYTVGIHVGKNYTFGPQSYYDQGTGTFDFLLGSATQLNPRDVVNFYTCSQCHTNLEVHGQRYNDVKYCNLCHVVGAQDANPTTPNNLIQLGPMIMRIHNGPYLPSVNGLSRDASGNVVFGPPQPFQYVDSQGTVHDYSKLQFPFDGTNFTPTFPHVIGWSPGATQQPTPLGMNAIDTATGTPETVPYTAKLTGVVSCFVCHGPGSLPPFAAQPPFPTQGDVTFKPQLQYCLSCHDDRVPTLSYIQNTVVGMPPTPDSTTCKLCHPPTGAGSITGSTSLFNAHVHPLRNTPQLNTTTGGPSAGGPENPGINFKITTVTLIDPATGQADAVGKAGDEVQLDFTVTTNEGDNFFPGTFPASSSPYVNGYNPRWLTTTPLTRVSGQFTGPTVNPQTFFPLGGESAIPVKALQLQVPSPSSGSFSSFFPSSGSVASLVSYTLMLPEPQVLEELGVSTGTAGETFKTAYAPTWDSLGTATSVFEGAVASIPTTNQDLNGSNFGTIASTAPVTSAQQFVQLTNINSFNALAGNTFVNKFVILNYNSVTPGTPNANEEIAQVQFFDAGNQRLWFTAPLRHAHATGEPVQAINVTPKVLSTDYTISAASGTITTVTAFTANDRVVATYTTNFRIPAVYPEPINGGDPTDKGLLGANVGNWFNKAFVPGTYMVNIYGNTSISHTRQPQSGDTRPAEPNTYGDCSPPAREYVNVGTSTTEPYPFISSGQNCEVCHQDLRFHGGFRRGFDTCIMCHGTSGFEDAPIYVKKNPALATPGLTTNYRVMLHKIHRGSSLYAYSNGQLNYQVQQSFGAAGTFQNVVFPAMPSGVKQCATCHGATNTAWKVPSDRDHPADIAAGTPQVKQWAEVCSSCHDDPAADSHIALMTASGQETCNLCHGTGGTYPVDVVHKVR